MKIIYIPNGGNGGDANCCWYYSIFDKHKIKYTIKDNSKKYIKILFYGGVGIVKKYNYCKIFLIII